MNRVESDPKQVGQKWAEYCVVTPQGEVRVVIQESKEPFWSVGVSWDSPAGFHIPYTAGSREEAERVAQAIASCYENTHPYVISPGIMSQLSDSEELPLRMTREMENLVSPLRLVTEALVRLNALYENPSEETWDDAFAICLRHDKPTDTLWQHVLAIDPTFPRVGPSQDTTGFHRTGWNRVPDRALVVAALQLASNPNFSGG